MRPWLASVPLVALFAIGCARQDTPRAALQPGDVVRAELSFAPKQPWHTGDLITVGVLLQGERPNGERYYVKDADVTLEQVVMKARITFLTNDQTPAEQPLDVPLVHDC
jgi:hypothetical protein